MGKLIHNVMANVVEALDMACDQLIDLDVYLRLVRDACSELAFEQSSERKLIHTHMGEDLLG